MPTEWVPKGRHDFSVEDLKRFQAAWMGLDYKTWVVSGDRDTDGNREMRNYFRAGLRAIFPNAAFEPE